ncbi:phosphatase PAP2 family protein [Vibrio litoralis]|uniref:phosphatase PAP2 family protein n=1 Tax=Vibrio litoralis TaxID=335972 RepID=UPI00041946FC|nr:phosphatase PAP2 family protein [Vibrio litoralis]
MVSQYPVYVRLALIWLGLAVVPSGLLLTGQQVFPWLDLSSWFAGLLYALTSTGTAPYAILTVVVFWAFSFKFMNKLYWQKMVLATLFGLSISFTLNHGLKSHFEEPRPNFTWLSQQANSPIDLSTFYQQEDKQRSADVEMALQQYRSESDPQQLNTNPPLNVSNSLQHHWVHEVGFAFPSGHTIFAITLTLIASYYLLLSGATTLNVIVFLWGLSMGTSRMLLGMHWPQDVLASTCLAVIISVLSVVVIEKGWGRFKLSSYAK